MNRCPINGRRLPTCICFCDDFDFVGPVLCQGCDMADWRVHLYWLLKRIPFLRALVTAALAATLFIATWLPAAAAHDPTHCNPLLEAALVAGKATVVGGYLQDTRAVATVIWQGYTYICVLARQDAITKACSIFPCRNATEYVAKDAIDHGATATKLTSSKVAQWAKGLAGPSGSNLIFAWPSQICAVAVWGASCTGGVRQ